MASSRVGRSATFAHVSPRATRGNARARTVVRGVSSSPPGDEMRRKLRLLCLHSFRTSGEILREQVRLAGWEETLGDLVEFHVMDAPHPASGPVPPDVLAFFPDVPYREWWNATERADPDGSGRKTMTYVGLEESLARVKREFDERGPFDGVLGFSQGATLTTILAAKGVADAWGPFADASAANASPDASRPKPKTPPVFAVCVSGAAARTREADATYRAARDANANANATDASTSASNSPSPSLHIIGEADRVVPPPASERAAARCFVDPVVARHPRGHVVPRLEGDAAETVRQFFLARVRERTDERTDTVPAAGARTTSAL
jgi:pimeloyl-ACP methyl ester carboxylesterase